MIRRGDIWWTSMPEPIGSEPGYRRPVVIVQADTFNQSRIRTVIAVALTTNMRLAESPGNVFLSSRQTGLPRDSVANVSQVITLDKGALTECIGRLGSGPMEAIETGLRLVLEL